jgi:hypothetical protein
MVDLTGAAGSVVARRLTTPTITRSDSPPVRALGRVAGGRRPEQRRPMVRLASHAGATVMATARGDDEAYLNSIGASQVIDYREAQFEKVLREKVDVVFDLIGGDTQKRSFLVLKEGGHLLAATQPVSQEETARHRVSGAMMRLAPSGDGLGRIARLPEEGTIRPDVATVYALQDAAQAWKKIAGNLTGVHGMSPSGPGAARHRPHGKIVLRVA